MIVSFNAEKALGKIQHHYKNSQQIRFRCNVPQNITKAISDKPTANHNQW